MDAIFDNRSGSTANGVTPNLLSVGRNYITFTFDFLPPDEDARARLEASIEGDILFFDDSQKSNTLLALDHISEITGIEFREASGNDSDWYFVRGRHVSGMENAGWVDGTVGGLQANGIITQWEIDNWLALNLVWEDETTPKDKALDKGTFGYSLILHELGHLLGLDHPFEDTILEAPFTEKNTLMSYDWAAERSNPTEFLPYDKAALAYIYGYDGLAGEYGIGTAKRIVLSVDGATVVVGGDFHDTIIGTDGNEALYGNGGDDILDGGWGSNEYYGGEGFDTAKLVLKSSDYATSKNPNTGDILLTYENGDAAGSISPDVEQIEFVDGVILSTDNISYTGIFTEIPESAVNPVYRFYNTEKKAFFYTSSEAEKDYVLANSSNSKPDSEEWPYVYQGATFEADFGNAPLYRFYNTETGHHFFTVNEEERDFVLSKSNSGEWPFNYEGVAFNVYAESHSFTTPVHRFYNPSLDRHFFTASESEAQDIQLIGQWNYEGIGFYGGDFYSAPNPFVIT